MPKIDNEELNKLNSYTDMKNMIERIAQRQMELDNLIELSGYKILADELDSLYWWERRIKNLVESFENTIYKK